MFGYKGVVPLGRFVIFEDNALIAEDLKGVVADAGHQVCEVFDNVGALADAISVRPDAAIIDLDLRDGRSGYGIAKALCENGCRIFIHSGFTNADKELCAIPHTYIAKPFDQRLMQVAVGKACTAV